MRKKKSGEGLLGSRFDTARIGWGVSPEDVGGTSGWRGRRISSKKPRFKAVKGLVSVPMLAGVGTRRIYGGSYLDKPNGMIGVRVAAEIKAPARYVVPTEDFQVPPIPELLAALEGVYRDLLHGRRVYVGCMGGIGRTGLFFACLLKLAGEKESVNEVRRQYLASAVETKEQAEFVHDLPIKALRRRLWWASLRYRILSWVLRLRG